MKDKFINFRATEKEKKQLSVLSKKAKLSQAEFIRHSVFNKEIIIIDSLKEFQKELKRIGNNLNQLTTRANMGQLSVINLEQTKDEIAKIHEKLAEICATKDKQISSDLLENEITSTDNHKSNAPNQCIRLEDEINYEELVCHQKSENLTEQIVQPAPVTRLGEKRNASIFSNMFDKSRGE